MKTIKFRAQALAGNIVIGSLIVYRECPAIKNFYAEYEVLPNTIAQFVGYDKNDNDIYTDDYVTDDFGETFRVEKYARFEEIGTKFKDWELKS